MRVGLFALALIAFAAGCGGDDEPAASGGGECENVEAPAAREPAPQEAPTEPLDASKSYALSFETSCGAFTIDLDLDLAPKTSASLVSLARAGYFDDTIFHRIVPGFVIQGGDPSQTGTGGPDYQTVDKPPAGSRYVKGVFAMAKTQADPPGAAGSQFFVVTGEDVGLPPEYAIAGKVGDGLDVVERIGALGGADERPTQPVVIRRVTVSES